MEEHRRAVHVDVAQQPAVIHVAHDALDRVECEIGVRRVVHRQEDAGDDHDHQHDPGERAEVPPISQVARGRVVVEFVLQRRDERQPIIDPADDPAYPAGAIFGHGALLADLDGDDRRGEAGRGSTADREIAPRLAGTRFGSIGAGEIGHADPLPCAPFTGAAVAARSYTVEEGELCDRLPQKSAAKCR